MKKTLLALIALVLLVTGFGLASAKNDDRSKDNDYKNKCSWSTRWDKNPETFRLEPGAKQTFVLIVANNNKSDKIKFDITSTSTAVTVDPSSVEVEAKKTTKVNITVVMPANTNNLEKVWFSVKIKPSCGEEKEIKFAVHYNKKICLFTAKWEKEPTFDQLNAGESKECVLLVTNPAKTDISIKVETKSTGIVFSSTSFTIKAGETFRLTIKVTQPTKGKDIKTVWTFVFISDCGLKKEFLIKAFYPIVCQFTTKWEKEPSGVVAAGTEVSYIMIITNLSKTVELKMTVAGDNPNMRFSVTSFTVAAGGIFKLVVTVKQPAQGNNVYSSWKITFTTDCGTTKVVVFKLKYVETKPECKFEVILPPGQDNKKVQRGKQMQINMQARNLGKESTDFTVTTNSNYAKPDPASFTLGSGKLGTFKIVITVPADYTQNYIVIEVTVKAACGQSKTLKVKLEVTK